MEEQSSKFKMDRHGEEVKKLAKSVEVFDVNGTRKWTSIETNCKGDDRPMGIRDSALALLGDDDSRAIFFGGYCGSGASCFHNSLHELNTESWEWHLLIGDTEDQETDAPMRKRNSGAVGFVREGKECVCIFAGNGLNDSSKYQKHSAYKSEMKQPDCVTNELHYAEITDHEGKLKYHAC